LFRNRIVTRRKRSGGDYFFILKQLPKKYDYFLEMLHKSDILIQYNDARDLCFIWKNILAKGADSTV